MSPPLCRRHNPERYLPQLATLAHNCRSVTSAESIATEPYRVSNQLAVSLIRQRSKKRSINQPAPEISRKSAILVINVLIHQSERVLQETVASRVIQGARKLIKRPLRSQNIPIGPRTHVEDVHERFDIRCKLRIGGDRDRHTIKNLFTVLTSTLITFVSKNTRFGILLKGKRSQSSLCCSMLR